MAEVVSIDDLTLDPANTRVHPEPNRRAMDASLKRFGPARSIVVDGNGVIRAGNGTIEAARAAGCTEVLVIDPEPGQLVAVRRKDWSPSEGTAYSISDNRSTDLSLNDDAALAATLRSLQSEDFDLEAVGYSDEEVDAICAGLADDTAGALDGGEDPGAQTDKADELREKWGTRLGQLWTIPSLSVPGKSHRLLCGDSTKAEDVAKVMGGEKWACMVTDPPYGVNYEGGRNPDSNVPREKIKGDSTADLYGEFLPRWTPSRDVKGVLYLWFADRHGRAVYAAVENSGFDVRALLVWNKIDAHYGNFMAQYMQKHEPCLYCVVDGTDWNGPTNEVSVWDIKQPTRNENHPTEKPLECMARPILNSTVAGRVVVDPFLGSGTTIVAAEQTGRLCYGIELAPKYCAVVLERLAGMGLTPALS